MDGAAEHGRLEVLEWLRRNRPEGWTLRAGAQAAARNGELAALSYLLLGGKGDAVDDFDDGFGGFGARGVCPTVEGACGAIGSGEGGGDGDDGGGGTGCRWHGGDARGVGGSVRRWGLVRAACGGCCCCCCCDDKTGDARHARHDGRSIRLCCCYSQQQREQHHQQQQRQACCCGRSRGPCPRASAAAAAITAGGGGNTQDVVTGPEVDGDGDGGDREGEAIDGLRLTGGGGIAPASTVTLDLDEAAAEGRLAVLEWARRATMIVDADDFSCCCSCGRRGSPAPVPPLPSAGPGNSLRMGPKSLPGEESLGTSSSESGNDACPALCRRCSCYNSCCGGQRGKSTDDKQNHREGQREQDGDLPLSHRWTHVDRGGEEEKEEEDRDGREKGVEDTFHASDSRGRDETRSFEEVSGPVTEAERNEPDEEEKEGGSKKDAYTRPRCFCRCRCGQYSGSDSGSGIHRHHRRYKRGDSVVLLTSISPAPRTGAAVTAATTPTLSVPPPAIPYSSTGACRVADSDSAVTTDNNGWRRDRSVFRGGSCSYTRSAGWDLVTVGLAQSGEDREREAVARSGGVRERGSGGERSRTGRARPAGGVDGRVAAGAGINRFRVAFTTAAVDGAAANGHLKVMIISQHRRFSSLLFVSGWWPQQEGCLSVEIRTVGRGWA